MKFETYVVSDKKKQRNEKLFFLCIGVCIKIELSLYFTEIVIIIIVIDFLSNGITEAVHGGPNA